jgi:hypothetical protein
MKEIKFSEQLLDTSYIILFMSGIKTEYDQAVFDCINEVCKANGVSFRKYMTMLSEIDSRLKELGEE